MGTPTIARDGRAPSSATVAMAVALALVIAMLAISVARMRGADRAGEGTASAPSVSHVALEDDATAPEVEWSLVSLGLGEPVALPASLDTLRRAERFVTSPDGRSIAFVADDPDAESGPQIFVMRADGTGVRQMTSRPYGADFPAWSPDGSELAFVATSGAGRDLFVSELADGATRRITRSGLVVDAAPGFLADGRIAFTAHGGRSEHAISIWVVPASGGQRELLIDRAGYGSVSPDGSAIAYHPMGPAVDPMTYPMDVGVWLARADGSHQRPLIDSCCRMMAPIDWAPTQPRWSPDGSRIALMTAPRPDARVVVLDADADYRRFIEAAGERWVPNLTYVGTGWGPSWLDADSLAVEALSPGPGIHPWPIPGSGDAAVVGRRSS